MSATKLPTLEDNIIKDGELYIEPIYRHTVFTFNEPKDL